MLIGSSRVITKENIAFYNTFFNSGIWGREGGTAPTQAGTRPPLPLPSPHSLRQ